jgi:bisphosphoglycerate-dependent phosphoglycerate mutase
MMARLEPVWRGCILPELAPGRTVLVAVHGIAIRALDEMIRDGRGERMKEIVNAAPIVYDGRNGVVEPASRRVLLPAPPGGFPKARTVQSRAANFGRSRLSRPA